MTESNFPDGYDIKELPLGTLLRKLTIGSWVWIISIVVGTFLLGYQAPTFLGLVKPAEMFDETDKARKQAETQIGELQTSVQSQQALIAGLEDALLTATDQVDSDLADAEIKLTELRKNALDHEALVVEQKSILGEQAAQVDGLRGEVEQLIAVRDQCRSDKATLSERTDEIGSELASCNRRLSGITVDLWYVHQGDGRGYPEGNNSDVHNHDDRPNWNSRRFKNEACLQHGGPRIDQSYAQGLCGNKRPVGPLGIFDVGGGTCGHGMYVIGCIE